MAAATYSGTGDLVGGVRALPHYCHHYISLGCAVNKISCDETCLSVCLLADNGPGVGRAAGHGHHPALQEHHAEPAERGEQRSAAAAAVKLSAQPSKLSGSQQTLLQTIQG